MCTIKIECVLAKKSYKIGRSNFEGKEIKFFPKVRWVASEWERDTITQTSECKKESSKRFVKKKS